MVNFGKFSSENTVIFDDFSPKMTTVRPKYVAWGSIQDGVAMTRIRYMVFFAPVSKYHIRVIATPSWLQPQETYFGCTLVIFGEKSSKITVFSDENLPKLTIVRGLKIQKINRTPGLQ